MKPISNNIGMSLKATRKIRQSKAGRRPSGPLAGPVATFLAAATITGLSIHSALAATQTWTGTTDANWATGTANWNGTSPVSGDSLVFTSATGAGGLTLVDNLMTPGAFNVAGITFNSGAAAFVINPNTVGTNGFTLTGDVTNSSTNLQTINDTITLNGTRTFATTAGGGDITLGGTLSGGALSKSGNGTLTLSGSNTTGAVTVNGGTLSIVGGSDAMTGGLVVNTATLSLQSGAVTVSGARFITNAAGAAINISGGTFTVSGNRNDNSIGDAGAASLSLTNSGTMTVTGFLNLGVRGDTTVSIANSASLTVDTLSFGWQANGLESGVGSITVSGSSSFAANSRFALNGQNTVALNLNGGMFTTTAFDRANTTGGTVTMNFHGGTLKSNGNAGAGSLANFLNGVNTAVVKAGGALIDTNGANITITQALTDGGGGGGLTKNGVGTLTLSGSNAYTGTTTINAGTLQIGNGTTDGSIITSSGITNNAALVVNPIGNSTYANVISGTGALTKNGVGTLTLSGSNAYTGATTISGGTLQIGNGTTDGSIATSSGITNNAALVVNLVGDATYANVISGTGALTKSGSGGLTLTGTNTYTGATIVNAGTLEFQAILASGSMTIASGATLAINIGSGLAPNGATITGTGTFVKKGVGNLVFGNGTVNMNLSIGALIDVQAGSIESSGAGRGIWTNNYADLNVASGASFSLKENQVYIGALLGSGTLSQNYPAASPSLTLGRGDRSGSFSGVIKSGASIEKVGAGTQILSGSNSYYGTTTVSGGRLVFVDNHSGGSTFTVAGGATLEFNTASAEQTLSGGTISGSGTLVKSGSSVMYLGGGQHVSMAGGLIDVQAGQLRGGSANGDWTNNKASLNVASGATVDLWDNPAGITVDALSGSGTVTHTSYGGTENFTVGVNNGSGTFTGTISDTSGHPLNLVKTGTGMQTLTGANTYSGSTTINAGALQFGDGVNNTVVSTGVVTVNPGATLAINLANSGTFGSQIFNTGTVNLNNSGTNTISGYLGGWYGTSINQSGSGTTILNHPSYTQYFGTININAGAVQLNTQGAALDSTMNIGVPNGLAFGVTTGTIGGLTGTSGVTLLTTSGSGVNLSVGYNGYDSTYSGVISGGSTSGLTKVGAGTLTLTGNNTYAGPTAITSGTLQIGDGTTDGSIATSSGITNNAALVVNLVGNATYANVISGTGALTKSGAGGLTLASANTYTGATTINSGTLTLQNGYATSGFAIGSGAVLELNVASGSRDGATTTFSGVGTILKTGTGTAVWGSSVATFTLGSGALIDVEGGTFFGGSWGNEVWTNNKSNLNVAAGAIFDGVEANVCVNALSGSGTIKSGFLGSGSLTFGVDNGSGTFSGVIANSLGAATIVKTGTGTQTLTGTNTYTGATIVNAGTLEFQAILASGSMTIASGATLAFNIGSASSMNGTTITGTGTFVKKGVGNLVFGNGTVNMNLSTGALIDVQAGSVESSSAGRGIWTNNYADLNVASGASFSLKENQVYIGALLGSGTLSQNYPAASPSLTLGRGDRSGTFSGVIKNGATIEKVGAGTQILSGSNSYYGSTTIDAGALQVGNGGATGSLSASSAISGSTGATLAFNRSDAAAIANTINGGLGVIQAGAGTLTLSGSNSYSGGTTVSSGSLQIGNANALGTGGLIVNNGTLDLANYSVKVGALSGSAGTITNSVSGTSTLTTSVASGTSTYNGNLANGTGAVVLTQSGSGTLILGGSLTIAGLNANSGVTQITQSGSIGAVSVAAGATLTMAAHSGSTYKVLDTSSLTLSGSTSTLDLVNNAMIVRASGTSENASNLATVKAAVNAASNGLQWNGAGLGSSTAFNEAGTGHTQALALMVYDNTVITQSSFEGVGGLGYFDSGSPVGFNQVLVKLTYLGDFNADGVINASDYTWLDGFALSGNTLGDLNGDGAVNATDYTWLDGSALNQSFGVLADSRSGILPLSAPAVSLAAPASPEAVPEPGSLGMLLAGALGMLGLRRQRSRNQDLEILSRRH